MGLVRLSEAQGYAVKAESADIRGWKAVTRDGTEAGRVEDLLFEQGDERVRFAVLALDGRHQVIWPVARLTLEEATRTVILEGLDKARLADLEPFEPEAPTLQLLEERLQVEKRRVQTGEVEVTRRPTYETVAQDVALWGEELEVERHAVERPATPEDRIQVEGDTIRVPIIRERLVVEKRAFVVEEIVLTRRRHERTERVEAELRRDELLIDGRPVDDAP